MSHVRRRPIPQRKSIAKSRQRKRKILGLLIMVILFVSIILSILFILLSSP